MRQIAAGLLAVGALLLFVAVSNESTGVDTTHESSQNNERHVETGTESSETAVPAADNHTENNVLGINTESHAAIAAALAISLLLGALIMIIQAHVIAVAVAVFALAFTVFDIAEVAHQINASETGLAIMAVVVAITHLSTAGFATAVIRPNNPLSDETLPPTRSPLG